MSIYSYNPKKKVYNIYKMKVKGLALIFSIAALEGLAIYLIKLFNNTKQLYYYIAALVIYAIMIHLISLSYSYLSVGVSQLLLSGLVMMFGLLLGAIMFGEKLSRNEWIGIGIIVAGIIMTQL
jgi:multidrug transporter EmrE-like cation transporter